MTASSSWWLAAGWSVCGPLASCCRSVAAGRQVEASMKSTRLPRVWRHREGERPKLLVASFCNLFASILCRHWSARRFHSCLFYDISSIFARVHPKWDGRYIGLRHIHDTASALHSCSIVLSCCPILACPSRSIYQQMWHSSVLLNPGLYYGELPVLLMESWLVIHVAWSWSNLPAILS